eukprot:5878140-Prymnesium_polylepis.5
MRFVNASSWDGGVATLRDTSPMRNPVMSSRRWASTSCAGERAARAAVVWALVAEICMATRHRPRNTRSRREHRAGPRYSASPHIAYMASDVTRSRA